MKFELSLILSLLCGAIFAAFFCAVCSRRLLGILQQENYGGKSFLKWYLRKGNIQRRRLSLLTLTLILLTALFQLCFSFLPYRAANLIAVLPFAGLFLLYIFSETKYALKVPVKPTARLVRLAVADAILLLILSCGLGFALAAASLAIDEKWFYLFRFVPFALLPVLLPFVAALANLLMKAYEAPRNRRFVKRAKGILAASGCIKVGITGSFGKTSVKQFAAAILSQKYRVLATPASYNTPMGIARTVQENKLDCDIFLAEMGARKSGDIAELCDLVAPTYGVVTGVCCQHLETFGTLEAVKAEKGVLAERAKTAILGRSAVGLGREDALSEGRDFAAEDIALSCEGVRFTLRLGEERIEVATELLGRHAAEDIALAAALCYALGMSAGEIGAGIGKITPVPHRLQRIDGAVTVLDDSYNSNVEGARDAVETLKLFRGKKYVVTPGLVELGQLEEEENEALGASFVGLDGVILVGETLVLSVRQGYLDAGGKEENLRVVPTLERASRLVGEELSAGDCVLFLNDLPDIY